MAASDSQTFLRELDKKLWTAADKLRSNLDAAVYKHAVLGLIFLKYVSDSFAQRQAEIEALVNDPASDFYLDPAGYGTPADHEAAVRAEQEERDYYTEKNVFWVPLLARWKTLQSSAKLPPGSELTTGEGKAVYKITSIGRLIDDALEAVEKENPKLKNVLNKNYTQLQIDPANLAGLIDLIATIPFQHADLHAKDILGHVYEYFLGQFALAEGKKVGQYFTPKSIVSLIVEMIEPYQGRVYDPAMGSGGFFVQSMRFIESRTEGDRSHDSGTRRASAGARVNHGGTIGDIMVFGQESNPTTWRLAAMNMAIRGIDFDFGKEPADTFTRDQHPDLRADFVMANPPFNIKEWWDGKLEGDARWSRSAAETAPHAISYKKRGKYGTPPQGNANFAWVQHMLHHLAPNGSMALLLANGSMSSNSSGEGDIRRALIEADLVECMVALPGQLFTNTQIPACIWFLTKNKSKRSRPGAAALRDRRGETLFIDARKLGFMKDRVLRDFSENDIEKIAGSFREWRSGSNDDVAGFCKSSDLKEITTHGHVLSPGRYVGAEDIIDDGDPFEEKMTRLALELKGQFQESARLQEAITANLESLGYGE
jgi:type I restriction enzyme M protein